MRCGTGAPYDSERARYRRFLHLICCWIERLLAREPTWTGPVRGIVRLAGIGDAPMHAFAKEPRTDPPAAALVLGHVAWFDGTTII